MVGNDDLVRWLQRHPIILLLTTASGGLVAAAAGFFAGLRSGLAEHVGLLGGVARGVASQLVQLDAARIRIGRRHTARMQLPILNFLYWFYLLLVVILGWLLLLVCYWFLEDFVLVSGRGRNIDVQVFHAWLAEGRYFLDGVNGEFGLAYNRLLLAHRLLLQVPRMVL
jgi:hypothetical protein